MEFLKNFVVTSDREYISDSLLPRVFDGSEGGPAFGVGFGARSDPGPKNDQRPKARICEHKSQL